MKHTWTPVLDLEAAAQKCVNHCGTVWLNGGREPSGECQPLPGADMVHPLQRPGTGPIPPTYMERVFGIPENAANVEALAFDEVRGYGVVSRFWSDGPFRFTPLPQVPGVWD